ncbi:3-carboxy-cis,cis-muconate cycloisomerase [Streptomyces sp. FH025]|uniref:3-carboxy-cis,cis-muconate cycloisomerase n=1 Tax=Streptomyces sp. FH025 TaxID=2815937 RepID=UPI001A9E81CA|nr:3-carboxy-cis,cis-muconate cycloisomerase [Streptomyces sp. FH025]MBO1413529.1 3-carboxy-cis,cis-muconate cycloisomerase [Streptomyces sp. FH025]
MTSADDSDGADLGLLSPVRAGTAVEAATGDRAFLQALLDAEAALTRAQARLGQAPAEAAATVTATARAERFDLRGLARRARAGGNPVIPLAADLTSAVPTEAAPYVHRGATSQDVLDTATMLVTARCLPVITADLHRTADLLGRLAAAHRLTPMAGRTLTQHAVPTTFGLKAAGWRGLVLDAADRLAAVRTPAQLGGAAGTLAAFDAPDGPALIAAYARELGLAEPELPWHTLRTPIADLAAALAFTTAALGKLAADVLVLSRTEIGELAEGRGGGSSALPHKANPVAATLIAAAARQAPPLAAVLIGALAAEDERPAGAWHAEWQPLRELLRLAGGAGAQAVRLCEGLRVFPDRMGDNLRLTRGLVAGERLVGELAALIGRGPARRLLERAARLATDEESDLAEVLAKEPALHGLISADRLHELTDPARYLGAAGALTDRALLRRPAPPVQENPS